MISAWEVYLFTRLDAIHVIAGAAIVMAAIGLLLFGIHYLFEDMWERDDDNKEKKKTVKTIKRLVAVAISGLLVCVIIPSTKEAAVIYLLPKIANNEQVQKVPENFVKLLNTKMEAWIEDFEKDKKK